MLIWFGSGYPRRRTYMGITCASECLDLDAQVGIDAADYEGNLEDGQEPSRPFPRVTGRMVGRTSAESTQVQPTRAWFRECPL